MSGTEEEWRCQFRPSAYEADGWMSDRKPERMSECFLFEVSMIILNSA
ncbi:MAG: hypothetical protein GY696_13810 [Gammaproteobacteria bacterium]|nr:hypothetical protein [Gammaproteobacteria bacterium]